MEYRGRPVRWPLTVLSFVAVAVLGIALSVAGVRLGLGVALVAAGAVLVGLIRAPDPAVGRSAFLGMAGGLAMVVLMGATF